MRIWHFISALIPGVEKATGKKEKGSDGNETFRS